MRIIRYLAKKNFTKLLKDFRYNDLDKIKSIFNSNIFRQTNPPEILDCISEKKILILSPHQDDGIIGAGGLILKSIKKGSTIRCLYITNGAVREKNI